LASLSVWLLFFLIFEGLPPVTALLIPVVALPLLAFTLGMTWFFSSLGVYVRDVSQIIGFAIQLLMFMSPVFYPLSALPESFRGIVSLVPLNLIIEDFRSCLIWGRGIHVIPWGIATLGSLVLAWLGFAWFQKTRRGFADVL
jgi:lipopolysaccharide transport system permease protein